MRKPGSPALFTCATCGHQFQSVPTGRKGAKHHCPKCATVATSKYRAKPTEVDGIRFASKAEAARYGVLKDWEAAGKIEGLELQPRYPLIVNGEKVGTYVADFRYVEVDAHGDFLEAVTEDVKGMQTPVYRLKKRLMKALYGITILET